MADPFSPKFIDLVRNYTTTVGAGDFVLGPAVNGFTGFTAALQVGDDFYYSALGVDKPAETEVGRGTLLVGGIVARDPIGGTKTNFSGGTKTIALIAAGEWFEAAHALVGSVSAVGESLVAAASASDARSALGLGDAAVEPASAFAATLADRTALAGCSPALMPYLRESQREGLFAFEASDLSPEVAADTAQGIYVAPASDSTGASGAWVRKFAGPVDPRWFGLVEGDDSANGPANAAALLAMWSCLRARAYNIASATSQALDPVRTPPGTFWLADNGTGAGIEITDGAVLFEGSGNSAAGANGATVFKAPPGVTAVRVQSRTTTGASGSGANHVAGSGSVLRNFALKGAFPASMVEAEAHGIHLRGTARVENVDVRDFEGDGFRIEATDATGDGNANVFRLDGCSAQGCRNGLFTEGSDVNAGTTIGFNANVNRQWGIWESSFLGNVHIGAQVANFGLSANGTPSSVVSFSGNQYFVIAGQEAGASVNAPSGTTADNIWWGYIGAGGVSASYPAWISGTAYRAGGSYHNDNLNQKNLVFVGCYDESNGARAQLGAPALIFGGFLALSPWKGANNGWGRAPKLASASAGGRWLTDSGIDCVSGTCTTRVGVGTNNTSFQFLSLIETANLTGQGMVLRLNGPDLTLCQGNNVASTARVFDITCPNTAAQFGTGAAVSQAFFPLRLMVGDSQANARLLFNGTVAPAAGAHGQGEVMFNRAPQAGSFFAQRCLTAGAPGAWEALYSGYGSGPIGYSPGAGGAVIQATSKSAGVALSKPCGQITMNGASLAPGAIVSFGLTNGEIAAGDILVLNHVSGGTPGAYSLNARSAAGSATIDVRNNSAAALAEAIVIAFAVIKAVNV